MSRRIAITAVMLLAATACTTSSDDDSKPSASPSGLAADWRPKLKTAATTDTGICNQAGDQACAEHLTDIALAVSDLKDAITDVGTSKYPHTAAEITKIDAAVQAYTDHECLGDDNASIQGSPCPDDARTIMSATDTLTLALEADET